jgi:hypothetical protein
MSKTIKHKELFDEFKHKASLKQDVYNKTLECFNELNEVLTDYVTLFNDYTKQSKPGFPLRFEVTHNKDFEIEMKFGGDILIFLMHTNIFEFPRDHEVMKTSYIKEDKDRSFHGIIHIYNFLADSFKYHRSNDIGYLIGRIFINKDKSYFIEGKKELAFLYHNFGSIKFDKEAMDELIEATIRYTINFDLLTPPYEDVMLVSVSEMQSTLDSISLKTGKRLGFKFYADNQNVD